ncbi:hypothetical protein [Frankia sp. QA3]|uniref:hypothetical protein n=1 Tax=Frankia sp. QA3 TaxID=710111 RepID=UPI000269C1FB|nr:hypothetical protein [Frankia sp. QA3]EIV92115.1 hypothetical protein FraQA3DRAFT_1621 [Frankia sp. QA3]
MSTDYELPAASGVGRMSPAGEVADSTDSSPDEDGLLRLLTEVVAVPWRLRRAAARAHAAGDGDPGWRARWALRRLVRACRAGRLAGVSALAYVVAASRPTRSGEHPTSQPPPLPAAAVRALHDELAIRIRYGTAPFSGWADAVVATIAPYWAHSCQPDLFGLVHTAVTGEGREDWQNITGRRARVARALPREDRLPLLLLRLRGQSPASPASPARGARQWALLTEVLARRWPREIVSAVAEADPALAQGAADTLRATSVPKALDELASACLRETSPATDRWLALLTDNRHLPADDAHRVVAAALRHDDGHLATHGAHGVGLLLDALVDRPVPRALADALRRALRHLTSPAARAELLVTAQLAPDSARRDEARSAAVEGDHVPAPGAERALFSFLSEQWDRYEEVDADGRLIADASGAAEKTTRAAVRAAARRYGRTDVVAVFLGGDPTAPTDAPDRVGELTRAEIDYVVGALIAEGRAEQAWRLAFRLPFVPALAVAARLRAAGYRPAGVADESLLAMAADAHARFGEAELDDQLATPPEPRRIEGHTRGSSGDRATPQALSFSPDGRELVIATHHDVSEPTGEGVYAVPNNCHVPSTRRQWIPYVRRSQYDQVELVDPAGGRLWCFDRLDGPVTEVCAAGGGRVFAAAARVGLFTRQAVLFLDGERRRELGFHQDAVVALMALSGGGALTVSLDRTIAFWDADGENGERLRVEDPSPHWAALSPDGRTLLVVGARLTRYDVQARRLITPVSQTRVRMSRFGFGPDGTGILTEFDGEQTIYNVERATRERSLPLPGYRGAPLGIFPLPGAGAVMVVRGSAGPQVLSWPDLAPVYDRTWAAPGKTEAAAVTAPGTHLATAHGATILLRDLRGVAVSRILRRPLRDARPGDAATLDEAASWLPATAVGAALLRHRL